MIYSDAWKEIEDSPECEHLFEELANITDEDDCIKCDECKAWLSDKNIDEGQEQCDKCYAKSQRQLDKWITRYQLAIN